MNIIKESWLAFREIKNYFFLKKIIEKNKNTEKWISYNLRVGYFNIIYTVISLRREDEGESEYVKRIRVLEYLKNIANHLDSLGLSEIIRPEISKIENSRSYLIVFKPVFKHFNLLLILKWIAIFLILYFIYKYKNHFIF